MKRFGRRDGQIVGSFDELDRVVLSAVPILIDGVGEVGVDPAAARLQPAVYRDDDARSAEFLRLSAGLIEDGRRADLASFSEALERSDDGVTLSDAEAESWMRVLTTARLVLGARLGIEEDGWERNPDVDVTDPRLVALFVLGRLQEDLVAALSAAA